MTQTDTPTDPVRPDELPGLDLAYGFVQPSYQWLLTRFEAAHTRLATLQAVIAGVTLAIPAVAPARTATLAFTDTRFLLAAAAGLAALVVGVVGRQVGTVRLAHPAKLKAWLTLSEAEFKYAALHWAADHFDHNLAAVEAAWRCAWAMLALFAVELGLLLWWLAG